MSAPPVSRPGTRLRSGVPLMLRDEVPVSRAGLADRMTVARRRLTASGRRRPLAPAPDAAHARGTTG